MPQRQYPRGTHQVRPSSSNSEPLHHRPIIDRSSPKLGYRRSPRGATQSDLLNQKKLGTHIVDLESQLRQAQEELKNLKDQLASAEAAKKKAQQELENKTKKPKARETVEHKKQPRSRPSNTSHADEVLKINLEDQATILLPDEVCIQHMKQQGDDYVAQVMRMKYREVDQAKPSAHEVCMQMLKHITAIVFHSV
ncbi:hypothetical protein GOBAR_AA19544 [Gossypium barbadense]|uniref:Uncharacterized protein n=1 Tax=Gossypium barbadense TaxID=3634 RepID=A0A2P5XCS9_GOSBA|nr:hypothetical protein GOBAR_AA19544 [Gossypium barbadense]